MDELVNRFWAQIFVLVEPPHQIIEAEGSIDGLFGKHVAEIRGRPLSVLTGPKSNLNLLEDAMTKAADGRDPVKMQHIFYDGPSKEKKLIVTFRVCRHLNCRIISFEPSEAISLPEALGQTAAQLIISANEPYDVCVENNQFKTKFDFSVRDGKLSDIPYFSSDDWTSMLKATRNGEVVERSIGMPWCGPLLPGGKIDIRCIPVVDAPNGYIRHIAVQFLSKSQSSYEPNLGTVWPTTTTCGGVSLGAGHGAVQPPIPCSQAKVGGNTSSGGLFLYSNRPVGPVIFPRRKSSLSFSSSADARYKPPAPVVVTPEVLVSLKDLPLTRAAAALGVSDTAFKKACRKLGVKRWAYTRRSRKGIPTACSSSRTPASASASTSASSASSPGSPPPSGSYFQSCSQWPSGDHPRDQHAGLIDTPPSGHAGSRLDAQMAAACHSNGSMALPAPAAPTLPPSFHAVIQGSCAGPRPPNASQAAIFRATIATAEAPVADHCGAAMDHAPTTALSPWTACCQDVPAAVCQSDCSSSRGWDRAMVGGPTTMEVSDDCGPLIEEAVGGGAESASERARGRGAEADDGLYGLGWWAAACAEAEDGDEETESPPEAGHGTGGGGADAWSLNGGFEELLHIGLPATPERDY